MSTIGSRLKNLREKSNISQEYIGEKFGLTKFQVSRMENGKTKIDPDLISKFAEFYNVSTDYLLNGVNFKAHEQVVDLSIEEQKILEEIKKHPALFHDLANAPEKKIKQLIRMWEFIKKDLEDDDDRDDIIDD
jgi:transcriptional regulator with XRE-family HTH domain